ncbi:hypothetical protein HJC23_013278 [Cyclotella cryptica]|uniref:Uncharacterized protein n=1 Tax=Cyclotella cryptica TaxID=29204 RepID=A0ABD3P7Q0_9STRA
MDDNNNFDPRQLSAHQPGSTGSLSGLSLSQLSQSQGASLSFSSLSLRHQFTSDYTTIHGSSGSLGVGARGMARSLSTGMPIAGGFSGGGAAGPQSRSASGRFHNETFRFPSVPEESGVAGGSSLANSLTNGSAARSHSTSAVLGNMFARHLTFDGGGLGLYRPAHPAHHSQTAGPANGIAPFRDGSGSPEAAPTPGPSELYRLISAPVPNYPAILSRCRSHPQEACSFSLHAGCGHVYALHRLLRRDDDDDKGHRDNNNSLGDGGGQAPYEVIEGVMRACPRAVVRKQAVCEEEDFMEHNQLPQPEDHTQPQDYQSRINSTRQDDEEQNFERDPDDVRYEYPLAIAAEYSHPPPVLRLLAKATTLAPAHYRSEVFRSLDYASLSNETVRILLEEYAGCVLERGDSEVNEGDDDDCPLEKVLFWWDDPDVTGMEEDIATYPECEMKDDLCDLWEKLRMMLYAATRKTMDGYDSSKEDFKVLHLLLRIVVHGGIQNVSFPNDFTHSVLLLAKFIQRERVSMFRERDESGSLPLHIAVSGSGLLRCEMASRENLAEGDHEQIDDHPEEALQDVDMGDGGDLDERDDPPLQDDERRMPQQENHVLQDGDDDHEDADEDESGISESDMEEDNNEGSSSVSCGMEIIKLLLEQHPSSIRLYDTPTRSLPIHLVLKHNPNAIEAIDHFIQLYPKSVTMPDGEGRLPIHIALLHNSPSWERILEIAPNTLEKKDPMTGLLPFQLAALHNSTINNDGTCSEDLASSTTQELTSLTTCFRLLRMNPHLASGLAEVSAPDAHPAELRVAKLEAENKMLRERVRELESNLMQFQLLIQASKNENALKKRKSFNSMDILRPRDGV